MASLKNSELFPKCDVIKSDIFNCGITILECAVL